MQTIGQPEKKEIKERKEIRKRNLEINIGVHGGGFSIISLTNSDKVGITFQINNKPSAIAKIEKPNYRAGGALTFGQFCALIAQMSVHRDKEINKKINSKNVDSKIKLEVTKALDELSKATVRFAKACGMMSDEVPGKVIVDA